MHFTKLTLVFLIIALTYLALAESREQRHPAKRGGYRLFKARNQRNNSNAHEHGRQHSSDHRKDRDEKDHDVEAGFEDYDDDEDALNELEGLSQEDANRILWLLKNKNKFSTPAPTTPFTPTTPAAPGPAPPPPIPPPPISPPISPPVSPPTAPPISPPPTSPGGPPVTPPVVRSNHRRHQKRFDF